MLPPGATPAGTIQCATCGQPINLGAGQPVSSPTNPAYPPTNPQYGPAMPQYGQAMPQYGAVMPQYGPPQPQYGQPQLQYGQPQPQYVQTPQQYGQAIPQSGPAMPQYGSAGPQYPPGKPQYGTVGAPYGSQPDDKKKRKLGLIIGLSVGGGVLALLVCVAAVAAYFFLPAGSDGELADGNAKQGSAAAAGSSATPGSADPFGPSVAFDSETTYAPRSSSLRYLWNNGDRFAIDFEYAADIGGNKSVLAGRVIYQMTDRKPATVLANENTVERQGNGTGFVVRPDGYLVTCAHVVQGATKLEVVLDGKTYPAKVIALDSKNDVAVVRIRADNLPHLPLSNSDDVRLAEDVRAFGYPLADQLGESIKITRGTVSGINQQGDNKVFQLDVSVNPGNSGGPLVNDRGQAVGVVSALLAGEDISSVSFAVPANAARSLLERANLKYDAAVDPAAPLNGPDLADRVQHSVALIKVTAGPGGIGIAERKVVQFRASWHTYVTDGSSGIRSGDGPFAQEQGVLLMSATGEVSYCDGKQTLPGGLGEIALVGLPPLADDESNSWQSTRVTLVPQQQVAQIGQESPPGYYPRRPEDILEQIYGRQPQRPTVTTVKLHPALEMTHYEVTGTSGDIVDIEKSCELVTIHAKGQEPYLRVNGNGTWQFDQGRGLPKSLEYSATMAITIDATTMRVPLKLTCKFVDEAQLAAAEAEAKRYLDAFQAESQAKADRAASIPLVPGLDKLDLGKGS